MSAIRQIAPRLCNGGQKIRLLEKIFLGRCAYVAYTNGSLYLEPEGSLSK